MLLFALSKIKILINRMSSVDVKFSIHTRSRQAFGRMRNSQIVRHKNGCYRIKMGRVISASVRFGFYEINSGLRMSVETR